MEEGLSKLSEKIKEEYVFVQDIKREVSKIISGQVDMINSLIIALLSNGHILVEGLPGLAKTTAIKTLAQTIKAQFQRIQFTPDLLPADITGTLIYHQSTGAFMIKKGPIFANIILADEINRAPAKVQSALLEAMQERQVTIGDNTYKLPDPFLVMATQNPIEQEGTYPLPEAQVDRFMLKINITYPSKEEEIKIIDTVTSGKTIDIQSVVTPEKIISARKLIENIYVDEKIKSYVVDIVNATRFPQKYKLDKIKPWIRYGASPRATIFLIQAAKASAFMDGRPYITPQDIKNVGFDVLRHRILLSYEAEAEDVSTETIIKMIFDTIEVP